VPANVNAKFVGRLYIPTKTNFGREEYTEKDRIIFVTLNANDEGYQNRPEHVQTDVKDAAAHLLLGAVALE